MKLFAYIVDLSGLGVSVFIPMSAGLDYLGCFPMVLHRCSDDDHVWRLLWLELTYL